MVRKKGSKNKATLGIDKDADEYKAIKASQEAMVWDLPNDPRID